MAARKSKSEGVGPQRPAPFAWATPEAMAAMSDAEWEAYRKAMSAYSNAIYDTRAKTASTNALLMALYYRELRRWEANPIPGRKPQPLGAAKLASAAQIGKLAYELGHPGKEAVISFVEFADAIPRGYGYYPGWSNTEHGKVLLSSNHWRMAIDLAIRGRNEGGDYAFYLADAWGHDETGLGTAPDVVIDRGRVLPPLRRTLNKAMTDGGLSRLPTSDGDMNNGDELPNEQRQNGDSSRLRNMGIGSVKIRRRSIGGRTSVE